MEKVLWTLWQCYAYEHISDIEKIINGRKEFISLILFLATKF